jgi:hypothetical protein
MRVRKGIADVRGLPTKLISLLEREVECPHLEPDQDLNYLEKITRAINYLRGLNWDDVPETSWQSMVPGYLREDWGILSYREWALIYILTVECPTEE